MNDTIAAIATAQGEGGISIVRISGERAKEVLEKCFRAAKKRPLTPNVLMYGHIIDQKGEMMDECMAVYMSAKASYTREDVVELQCHGGSACAAAALNRVLETGVRPAGPGEFTKRAFLNGRIDLAEAEAVMSVIGAKCDAALRAGMRQLNGGVSAFVKDVSERITKLLAGIAAATDFPEEIDEAEAAGDVLGGIRGIIDELNRRLDERGARILREGASIVLSGRPNVGKSSLMNALLNRDRAIVTAIPGTTRDVLTERIRIGGVWAELSDTAGIREADDPIERMGVERAAAAAKEADVVLLVLDASQSMTAEDAESVRNADERTVVCVNKKDLGEKITSEEIRSIRPDAEIIEISARTGDGMDRLTGALQRRIGAEDLREEMLVCSRHIALAEQTRAILEDAMAAVESGVPVDVTAGELERALETLTEITGGNAREDAIDRVFRDFCVGK